MKIEKEKINRSKQKAKVKKPKLKGEK